MAILECYEILLTSLLLTIEVVFGRECYNYKEEPTTRDCPHGCCGDQYAQYCCDATMQIMGSVLGGLVVLGIIIAVLVYCYTKKSKGRQMVSSGGILGRLGLRSRNVNQQNTRPGPPLVPVPRGRPFRIPSNQQPPPMGGNAYYNPSYDPNHASNIQPSPGNFTYGVNQAPPYPPTAPMPPPYDMAPPPYSVGKQEPPPPPEYHSYIGHMNTQGCKPGEYSDGMPPPAY